MCRHRWSVQMTMKKNINWSFQPAQWLSWAEGAFISWRGRGRQSSSSADESHSVRWKLHFHPLSSWSVCSSDVYRHETGKCHSLSFILINFLSYIQVRDVLCYKLIPTIYKTSLLQNSLKIIRNFNLSALIGFKCISPKNTQIWFIYYNVCKNDQF